jgi:cyclopropane fatty-acyl-phospholipid synthase-like methyltransferase
LVIGSHLAHDPALGWASRLAAKLFGAPEIGLRTRTLHVVRIAEGIRGRRILDVGCGAGFISLTLASRNPNLEITGVDVNAPQIGRAREIAASAGLSNATFATSFDELSATPYDVVLCVDTLEYVCDPQSLLHAIHNRLEPDGALVLHCRRIPTPRLLHRFRDLDPLQDGRLRAGYDAGTLTALLNAAGLMPSELRETTKATAELGFELTHAEHGPVKSRIGRYALLPILTLLARLDVGGRGAGLLIVARRS